MIDIRARHIDIEDDNLNCIIEYPVIEAIENDSFVKYINKKIYEDVIIFKEISKEEATCSKEKSTIFIDYKVQLNKNNLISISIVFSEIYKNNHIINYTNIYNYNLKNKNQILIEDIFKKEFNYMEFIKNQTNNLINPMLIESINAQPFYITQEYISINFSSYEITDFNEIEEIKLYFKDLEKYLSKYTKKYILE
jgi:hypothetical protein